MKILRNKYLKAGLIITLVFWVQEMTASSILDFKRLESFILIFIPLLFLFILLIKNIYRYYLDEIKTTSVKVNITFYSFLIFGFLLISFGEKNKICFSGNCENGYGIALYKSTGDGDLFGIYFSNNIVWYEQNSVDRIYEGEFQDGSPNGTGEEFNMIYEYDSNTNNKLYVDGIFVRKGVFINGRLVESVYGDTLVKLGKGSIKSILEYHLLDYNGKRNNLYWK